MAISGCPRLEESYDHSPAAVLQFLAHEMLDRILEGDIPRKIDDVEWETTKSARMSGPSSEALTDGSLGPTAGRPVA